MTLVDSPLHIPSQFGGWDPASIPDLASLGCTRLPRCYEFDLTTTPDTIKTNLGPHLAKVNGTLVVNGEFFNADDPASLDVRRVEKFAEDLDLLRSLTPPGTKIYWFGGPVIGSSLTDPAEVLKTHLADAAFVSHGIAKRIDGIAWGTYYGTAAKVRLRAFFDSVRAGCQLAADYSLPVMLYLSHFDFSTPHDRLPLATWGAYLQEASRVLDDQVAQSVAWYATPPDVSLPKWDGADPLYLAAMQGLLS